MVWSHNVLHTHILFPFFLCFSKLMLAFLLVLCLKRLNTHKFYFNTLENQFNNISEIIAFSELFNKCLNCVNDKWEKVIIAQEQDVMRSWLWNGVNQRGKKVILWKIFNEIRLTENFPPRYNLMKHKLQTAMWWISSNEPWVNW